MTQRPPSIDTSDDLSEEGLEDESLWNNALRAAALFAVDPIGLGGVNVRAGAGPVRDQWLAKFQKWLAPRTPMRKVPLNVTDARLLGGIDLAATLRTGQVVSEVGLLADTDGGIVVLAMAERMTAATAGRFAAALDLHEVIAERTGATRRTNARIGVVALDEGDKDEEHTPAILLDRFAFFIDLNSVPARATEPLGLVHTDMIVAARKKLNAVQVSEATLQGLATTAQALGIDSLRVVHLAIRAARASAALAGRIETLEPDAVAAARLVLAPRARHLPESMATEPDTQQSDQDPRPPSDAVEPTAQEDSGQRLQDQNEDQNENQQSRDNQGSTQSSFDEIVIEAARAAIPAGLLSRIESGQTGLAHARSSGKSGMVQRTGHRGRPAGVRRAEPRGPFRLNIPETLRAAAPWQTLRHRETLSVAGSIPDSRKVIVRREDFHVTRIKQKAGTTTVFVVDASGSAALARLAEAKGAVELLLADCYIRRDRVAMIAFSGHGAQIVLPPTRSLVRAKRSLAGLAAGGGTPLSAAIDAACELAISLRRQGETATLVLLTDGRANIARDGTPAREQAELDTLQSSRRLRSLGVATLVIDTSSRPREQARLLADAMDARYLPLPYADATTLSQAVQLAGTE